MKIAHLLNDLKAHNITVKVVDERLKLYYESDEIPAYLVEEVRKNKALLMDFLTQKNRPNTPAIPKAQEHAEGYELSSPQRRSWIISNLGEKSNIAYTMSSAITIEGNLNEVVLDKAFSRLIERHEILRTVFKQTNDGEIRQYVQSLDEVKFRLNTHRGIRSEAEIDALIYDELQKPFDLSKGPLLKCNLLKIEERKWVLSLMIHHIACDSKSMEILFRDVMFFYKGEIEGNSIELLPELEIQFKDYAEWSNSQYLKNKLEADKEYWLDKFKGEIPKLDFSIGNTRSIELKVDIGILKMELQSEIFNRFKSLCKENKVTLFSGLVTLLKLVFYRYSNEKDITIGFPHYNRTHPALDNTIGFFADTFVLRTQFEGSESFEEFLALVNKNLLGAYEHSNYRFEDLVQDLNVKRELNRNILFDVFVIFQNFKKADTSLSIEGLEVEQYKAMDSRFGAFDLSFNFSELEVGLTCEIEYKKNIYSGKTIKQLIKHLELLLLSAVGNPKKGISEIDIIPQEEKENILQFGNSGKEHKIAERHLDFSLFYFGNQGGEKNNYELVLKGAEVADKNSYSAVWTPERHFNEFGAPFPSPSVLGAALAVTTNSINIRSGSVVPPLHHPVRIAEEWAMVDNLSGGRAEVSFASGWNSNDFIFYPEDYTNRHAVMYKKIETIKKLWKGDKMTYQNPENVPIDIEIFPKPLQKDIPIWITATGAIETFMTTGKIGAGVLTGLLNDDLNELEEKITAYKNAYRAHKHEGDPRVAVMLHTYVDDSIQKAHDIARKPLKEYLRKQLEMFQNILNKNVEEGVSDEVDQLLELSVDKYLNNKSLIGTKDSCAPLLEKLCSIGVTEIACLIDFGIETNTVIKGLDKLTTLKENFTLRQEPIRASQKPDEMVETKMRQEEEGWTILDLFAQNVLKSPDSLAMTCQKKQYTYAQLNDQAEQLANHLSALGIGNGDLVPVCTSRSAFMIVAILGVLKAGAAYVPINAKYPKNRIDFILKDTSASVVVTESLLKTGFEQDHEIRTICVDELEEVDTSTVKQSTSINWNQPAYVMYTSGTTGNPKGVVISHRSLASFIEGISEKLQVNRDIKILSITDFTFDISIMEYFLPLSLGGSLVLADEDGVKNLELLKDLIATETPTHLQATPTVWKMLIESGWKNSTQTEILSGGETLKEKLKNHLTAVAPNNTIWNLYGPTEATIWASLAKITKEEPVTIGTPLRTVRLYVLSDDLQMKPIGIPGELYIGGPQLAERYINQPALTAEKFLKNPFVKGEYLYKTGDLVKWSSEGMLEFLSRKDRQVKISGHRIEVEEIENHLERLPKIQQALVVCADIEGTQQLVAYIVSEEFNEEEAISSLKNQLPHYMIPHTYMVLEAFPLTISGKINVKALPTPGSQIRSSYVAPANRLEEQLVSLWASVLDMGTEKIGIRHNFFELGGNSIKAITLQNKIKAVFGIRIKLEQFFRAPSIQEMAQTIATLNSRNIEKPTMTV